jgi:hypothetical protein
MTEQRLHAGLTAERWQAMSLVEQMGNIGSEISRALRAREKSDEDRLQGSLDRALELFDRTLSDPGLQGRRREICRAREVMLDYLVGSNDYASTPASLDDYYLRFGMKARLQSG